MYTLILTTVVAVLLFLLHYWRYHKSWHYDFFLSSVLAVVLYFCVNVLIGYCVDSCFPRKIVTHEHHLAAMRTTESTKGAFVLGSGSVQSNAVYQVYLVNGDGSLTPARIAADSLVRIVEDSSLKDVGYWTETVTVKDYSQGPNNWLIRRSTKETIVGEELRVPVGTVLHSFSGQ